VKTCTEAFINRYTDNSNVCCIFITYINAQVTIIKNLLTYIHCDKLT